MLVRGEVIMLVQPDLRALPNGLAANERSWPVVSRRALVSRQCQRN